MEPVKETMEKSALWPTGPGQFPNQIRFVIGAIQPSRGYKRVIRPKHQGLRIESDTPRNLSRSVLQRRLRACTTSPREPECFCQAEAIA